jgi:hypothetical protein
MWIIVGVFATDEWGQLVFDWLEDIAFFQIVDGSSQHAVLLFSGSMWSI